MSSSSSPSPPTSWTPSSSWGEACRRRPKSPRSRSAAPVGGGEAGAGAVGVERGPGARRARAERREARRGGPNAPPRRSPTGEGDGAVVGAVVERAESAPRANWCRSGGDDRRVTGRGCPCIPEAVASTFPPSSERSGKGMGPRLGPFGAVSSLTHLRPGCSGTGTTHSHRALSSPEGSSPAWSGRCDLRCPGATVPLAALARDDLSAKMRPRARDPARRGREGEWKHVPVLRE